MSHLEQRTGEEALRAGGEAAPQRELLTDVEIAVWLQKRIGEDERLVVQANLPKRKYTPVSGGPDFAAYLAGDPRHIYASRPRQSEGLTWVLCFDFDDTGHQTPLHVAEELSKAGTKPVYWERSDGGHLELYFDRPVIPEVITSWAEQVAPAITVCDEAYPAAGDGKQWRDCKHQAISWPLLRLEDKQVISCPMHAFAAGANWYSPGWLEAEGQGPIREALAYCVTSADLFPQDQWSGSVERPREPPPLSASLPDRPGRERPRQPQTLVEAAIAWWKARHTAEDVFTGNERWKDGYLAVRDERTPSVRQDRDGYPEPMFTDFGTGEKLDLFELYCRLRKLDKRQEIWRIVDEYLVAHGKRPVKRRF